MCCKVHRSEIVSSATFLFPAKAAGLVKTTCPETQTPNCPFLELCETILECNESQMRRMVADDNNDNEHATSHLCRGDRWCPEPPPSSDFLRFFNLNSRLFGKLYDSFEKEGQIDHIWGWIWAFPHWTGCKTKTYHILTLISQWECHQSRLHLKINRFV